MQCFPLGVDGNHLIATGGIDGNVTQPFLDDGDIHSRQQQVAGRGVTPEMDRVKSLVFEGRYLGPRLRQIVLTEEVESRAGEARAPLVDKEKVAMRGLRNSPLGFQIGAQEGHGGVPQGDGTRLIPLALEEDPLLMEVEILEANGAEL